MGKWRRLRWLHTMEWIVSLYDWAKDKVAWLWGIVGGLVLMSWADLVPWLLTAVVIAGGVVLLVDHFRRRPTVATDPVLPKDTRECIQMAGELYTLLEHQFDTHGEFIKGNKGESIKINLLYHKFRGRVRAQRKECPARAPYESQSQS